MARKSCKTELHLTERALQDLAGIRAFSIERFGKPIAKKYITAFQAAFELLTEQPKLLRNEEGFHDSLKFYRIEKHFLVCEVQPSAILVLAILSTSQDIPTRLADLEPTLALEAQMLQRKLQQARKKRKP